MQRPTVATKEDYESARAYIKRVYMKNKHAFEFVAIEGYVSRLENKVKKLKAALLEAEQTIPHGDLPVDKNA
jgi:hypothetical protein